MVQVGAESGFVSPASVPESLGRPENTFLRRRQVLVVIVFSVIAVFCAFEMYGCLNPTKGLDTALGGGAAATKFAVAVPTVTPLVGVVGFGATAVVPVGATAVLDYSIPCRVSGDTVAGGVRLAVGALVYATGWSYARGGMVYLANPGAGWVSAVYVNCPSSVLNVEKPFFEDIGTVTPAATSTSRVSVVNRVVTVAVPVVQTVVVTPVGGGQVSAGAVSCGNAIWLDSAGCVHLDIYGVKSLMVNGLAASGGTVVCNVTSVWVSR
jgi:hypothetical protein